MRKVSGIGKVSERLLQVVDVKTCGDLFNQRYLVWQLFTRIMALNFLRLSLGLGTSEMDTEELCEEGALPAKRKGGLLKGRGAKRTRKSMSSERTFRSTRAESDLLEKLAQISNRLAASMEKADLKARSITVKMKSDRFEVKQRSKMLEFHTRDEAVIFKTAVELLKAGPLIPLRLIGVRLACFEGDDEDGTDEKSAVDISTFFSKARKNSFEETPHQPQQQKEEEGASSDQQSGDEEMSDLLVSSGNEEEEGDWDDERDAIDGYERNSTGIDDSGGVHAISQRFVDYASEEEAEDECSLRALQDLAEEEEVEERERELEDALCTPSPSDVLSSMKGSPSLSSSGKKASSQPQIVVNLCPTPQEESGRPPIAVVASVGTKEQQLEEEGTECPVCCRRIYATSEAVLHHHIDRCLTRAAKEEAQAKPKSKSILHFFGSS